jgi:hypothetical protein
MIVQYVKFRSPLPESEIMRTIEERAPQYRALPGLLQKLYIADRDSGEFGGVYVWKDEESMREFRESDLGRAVPEVYKVEGELSRDVVDVIYLLREGVGLAAAD